MTVVCATVRDGYVHLGADSCVSGGGSRDGLAYPKVITVGEMVIGCAGNIRGINVIQAALKLPPHRPGQDARDYIALDLVKRLFTLCGAHGCLVPEDGPGNQHRLPVQLLIGYRGRVFELYADGAVIEPATGDASIGSGGEVARGSLYSTRISAAAMEPEERLRIALEAASAFVTTCAPPFTYHTLPPSAPPRPGRSRPREREKAPAKRAAKPAKTARSQNTRTTKPARSTRKNPSSTKRSKR